MAAVGTLLDQQTKQLQGSRISPVQIFQDEERRLLFGKFQENGNDGFKRFLALTLWGEVERRIMTFRQRK